MECPFDGNRMCRCLLWRLCPERMAYDLHRRPGSLAGPSDRAGARSPPGATATAADSGKPAPIPGSGSALSTDLKE